MSTPTVQLKITRIEEKKALYTKRAKDAREKNRPDIEKIWLDEIKVLDEEYDQLVSKSRVDAVTTKSPSPESRQTTAKNQRRLRQLNNQIQYIERKIAIHTERNEQQAVDKQTALLNTLLEEKSRLETPSPQPTTQKPPLQTLSDNQSSEEKAPQPVATTRALSSNDQKKINQLNADIAHADKMIKEYQKFKSPKAETWIGRKFQLLAQRDQLLQSRRPQTPPPLPARPDKPKPQVNEVIVAAQSINNQVRVLDLEISHADKMIREYQKYQSPKADQWIQRKNDLLARRAQITGQSNKPTAATNTQQNAGVKKRLNVIAIELAHADKMIREYQKYNSPKVNDWIYRKNALLNEKAQLEGKAISTPARPPVAPQTVNRSQIKAQISELNNKARDADTRMRSALKQGNHQQANDYLRKRNQYNEQVKQLTASLTGATVASSNIRPPSVTTPQTPPKKPSTIPNKDTARASSLEKEIARKYLTTRNYTNEHAYMEVINTLLSQSKYQHLTPAKETLYDITHPSKLPPAGTVINNPYIRDCFKIKISDITLEGYTINDTIFDTSFPKDFDGMIDRINQNVSPAPELKYYKYLAHRDAIQLIPSDRSITKYNSQFAGAKLKNITIKNIKVNSKGALQGLFASDGSFENIHMENITVQTNSAHQIAILGLLSGTLDLSSPDGTPIHVNLLPLRLAGGNNIYINSFSSRSSYQYGSVNAGNSNAVIADNRQKMLKRGTYYQNFNMDDFFAAMRRSDPNTHVLTRIKEAAKMAGTLAKVV